MLLLRKLKGKDKMRKRKAASNKVFKELAGADSDQEVLK